MLLNYSGLNQDAKTPFFETENWQTLSKMPYSQGKKNSTNSAAAGVFTMKLIMIKNCYLHKNDTSRFFVSNVSIGFHQRELCNEHSQVETQGVNSLLRSFWNTNRDNAPSILEINIKWKDLPPFGFHYKPKNIENHSDPRDCVKIHLIHIKKNCISKAERINCLGFQNADPKANCSEISGKPGNAAQVWYSPTVPALIKPRDEGIFCRLVSHGRWPKQLLWTKCLHEIFGSVFCLTNPSTKSLLLQSSRSRHTQISLLQSDHQEDAVRRWRAREAINH